MNQIETKKIAFIQAAWHAEIVQQSYEGFVAALNGQIPSSNIDVFDVPGSLEIPLQAQSLARSRQYDLIVAAGLIVDGGIYRHDFVARSVLDGIMRVQLENDVPVLSVVLTPHHFQETQQHKDFFFEHFKLKGEEAAKACLLVLQNRSRMARVA